MASRRTSRTKRTMTPACGSWSNAPRVRASTAWTIHTPRSRWFSEVTVTKVEVGA